MEMDLWQELQQIKGMIAAVQEHLGMLKEEKQDKK